MNSSCKKGGSPSPSKQSTSPVAPTDASPKVIFIEDPLFFKTKHEAESYRGYRIKIADIGGTLASMIINCYEVIKNEGEVKKIIEYLSNNMIHKAVEEFLRLE